MNTVKRSKTILAKSTYK